MTYYIFLENEKLNGAGQCPVINEEVENLEVSEDVYNKNINQNILKLFNIFSIIVNHVYVK